MRTPAEHVAADGTKTYRVRFRQGGTQTSQTFRRLPDAKTFAAILDGGGVTDALEWLKARDNRASVATFAEFFEHYVDQLTGVQPRTRADYRSLHRRYLSHLDAMPLPLITRSHVTALVNNLEAAGRSPKTIKNLVHMLSSCFALAIDEDHIIKNPCRRVKLPQARRDLEREQGKFLKPHEFTAILANLPEHYRPLFIFLIGSGLRWSEATALQSRHVDLDNGTVTVVQAWKRVPGRGWELGAPKSEASNRTINPSVQALAATMPLPPKRTAFVFTTPQGNVIRHANFYNRVWVPACKAAGLDPVPGIHATRHTHASWLISDGQSLEAVQDQLGHESILTTRKVYGHLQPAVGVALGKSASATLARALADGPDLRAIDRGVRAADQ